MSPAEVAGLAVRVSFGEGLGGACVRFAGDDDLARAFASVFSTHAAPCSGEGGAFDYVVKADAGGAPARLRDYQIRDAHGDVLGCGLSSAQAVGVLDAAFEARVRGRATGSVCALHSCGVLVSGGVVALVGVSGSGKTTLGLACAGAGLPHAGDEFGFLDLESGRCRHAEYPLGLKEGRHAGFLAGVVGAGLASESPCGVRSRLFSRRQIASSLGLAVASADEPRPLVGIVSVGRADRAGATFERLSVARWPDEVMPSVDGVLPRDELFRALLSLSSRNQVRVIRLAYAEADEGAALLAREFA